MPGHDLEEQRDEHERREQRARADERPALTTLNTGSRKRRRGRIGSLARRSRRGFEAVTVSEIAEAADVSQKTVFNYFPTKEDLVYEREAAVEEALLESVRELGPLEGMRRFLLNVFSRLGEKGAPETMAVRARIIASSPALQARERAIFAGYTRALAELLGEQSGAEREDVRAFVAANALIGVNRALLDSARRKVLAGRRGARLVKEIHAEAEQALDLLERGLRGYSRKRR